MTVGIIPNINKENILAVVEELAVKLNNQKIEFVISKALLKFCKSFSSLLKKTAFMEHRKLAENCDIVISIGGDGTMLTTAYEIMGSDTPVAGINFGKLGFLAEFGIDEIDQLITQILKGDYKIEERMILEGRCYADEKVKLIGINDIVIDKGRWPKMIELAIKIDHEYVSTFSADGVILATPTGSTGYSLSAGGPVVSPQANAITLNPISPHMLTMRPLILPDSGMITATVDSLYETVQVNCDGQRVYYFKTPVTLEIFKSKDSIKLIQTRHKNYFEILRNKLFWGMDVRLPGLMSRGIK